MSIILGIDFGTSGVRVGAFNLERKEFVRIAEAGYPTSYPHPGWAEQQPEDWWSAFQQALNSLFSDPQCRDADALTVVTTSSTVVIADEKGAPLRPAILWMDARSEAESAFTATISHPVLKFSGGSDAVEWLLADEVPLALFAVGALNRDSVLVEAGNLPLEKLEDLKRLGGVGDILGRFIDQDGKIVASEIDGRTVGLHPGQLHSKTHSICVAGGKAKHLAVLGALSAGYCNILITDQETALFLLQQP